eukprot:CAMPEP_0170747796 /NCGR_PEP_ID=MMETSP0437-20130122/9511_1 /TAXON_ID=0 /ORGANISM="Sexangularia sp." /LENGTH=131 /DNA_ID=CAMNT_0011086593 /DNA_START=49 /DNA_END=444 /DNA_ORIENTATION=+
MSGDADVTPLDQQMINEYGRWMAEKKEALGKRKVLVVDSEAVEEAVDELCLVDGDTVPLLVGDSFVHVSVSTAETKLTKRLETLQREIAKVDEQVAGLSSSLDKHKAILKAKFKDAINLEDAEVEELAKEK